MRKLFTKGVIVAISIFVILVVGVVGIVNYSLNTTIPATIIVTEPAQTLNAQLYTDLNCTTVWAGIMDFGSVLTTGSPVTKILYFKASRSNLVPAGYGFGEINPTTVTAVANGLDPLIGTFSYIVGEPFGTVMNGNHPCMITLSFTPIGAGIDTFNIVVTGTN